MKILDRRPIVLAVAGPNGAGKSTFYGAHLHSCGLCSVNADDLARRLELDPYKAAEAANRIREQLLKQRESFVFETVFSDPVGEKLRFLKDAEGSGYTVVLFFIGVDTAEASEERVAMRVAKGGHDVPRDKIMSRYARVMENLRRALTELANVRVFDNSNLLAPYRLVAVKEEGTLSLVSPVPRWLRPLLPPR
jgi:predicted ABC-type ATPase